MTMDSRRKIEDLASDIDDVATSAEELQTLMKRFQGNMMRVARELDRKPALVYRWARRFGLPVAEFRPKEGSAGGSSSDGDADE